MNDEVEAYRKRMRNVSQRRRQSINDDDRQKENRLKRIDKISQKVIKGL